MVIPIMNEHNSKKIKIKIKKIIEEIHQTAGLEVLLETNQLLALRKSYEEKRKSSQIPR